jgi:hypothetical protein
MPWIERPDLVDDGEGFAPWKGWGRNPSVFHWNIAERAIFPVQLDVVLTNPERRRQFLVLVKQLVAFTIQSSRAPWATRATIALVCDILLDNGVRGAAFLLQQQLRQDAR